AFLEHADRGFRRKLLEADGGCEPRGAAADDHGVVLHGFARHGANYNQPREWIKSRTKGRTKRRRSCTSSAFRSAGATWMRWGTSTTRSTSATWSRRASAGSTRWFRTRRPGRAPAS